MSAQLIQPAATISAPIHVASRHAYAAASVALMSLIGFAVLSVLPAVIAGSLAGGAL